MELVYRGSAYKHEPIGLEITEGEILGRYRGTSWRCHTLHGLEIPGSANQHQPLVYRGIPYAGGELNAESGRPQVVVLSQKTQTSTLVKQSAAEAHHRNLQRSLERRLAAAQARNDRALILQLEAESKQLSL
jgi:hypothetical protein